MNNIQLLTLCLGLLHMPLAMTVWAMLKGRGSQPALRLWVLGAMAMGLGTSGFAMRNHAPDGLTFECSYGLMTLSVLLRLGALRVDQGLVTPWPRLLAAWLGVMLTYSALVQSERLRGALLFGSACFALATACFAYQAWLAGRQQTSRSGLVLAVFEALFCVALALRLLLVLLGLSPALPFDPGWATLLANITGVGAALYGNLGYLGMALDRSNAQARRSRDAELAEILRRELAESSAEQLRALVSQRDRLLHVLAHEIRQPLHNAGGALAAACEVLEHPDADSPQRATTRLRQAQEVLDHMRSVLDNTLAATSLLTRQAPLAVQNVELDFLVELTLGDLPPGLRAGIAVERSTALRACELEYNLVRLALRNLLRNALAHAGGGARVTVRIEQQALPPTLVLAVCDDGPGLAAIPPAGQDSGLGLGIVRQVMALHGGRLALSERSPRGLRAAMEFPLRGPRPA